MESYYMEAETLIWYQDPIESGTFTNWEMFAQELLIIFGPIAYDD